MLLPFDALAQARGGCARRGGARLGEVIARAGVDVVVSDRLDALAAAGVDVAVDFTRPDAVLPNARWYAEHRIHGVIGTTGITADDVERIAELADGSGTNFVVAPDFSYGGAVMLEMLRLPRVISRTSSSSIRICRPKRCSERNA